MSIGLGGAADDVVVVASGQHLMCLRLPSNYIAKNDLELLILLPSLPWVLR